jgi:ABC-2 type transport system permease protein
VRQDARIHGSDQGLTKPIFFPGNAIYPFEIMPDWLKVVSLTQSLE